MQVQSMPCARSEVTGRTCRADGWQAATGWAGLGNRSREAGKPSCFGFRGLCDPALVLDCPETRAPPLDQRRGPVQLPLPTPCLSPACSELPSMGRLDSNSGLAVSTLVQLLK